MSKQGFQRMSVMVALAAVSAPAWADLPTDRTIAFRIRNQPTDPNSPVIFVVQMHLEAMEESSSRVGWQVASIDITRKGVSPELNITWTEQAPEVDTADGLWWIKHTDPAAPTNPEFRRPPAMWGIAETLSPGMSDLSYFLEGATGVLPPVGSIYPITAVLSYTISLVGEPLEDEGEQPVDASDEPVDMPLETEDPMRA